ncbi:hypothetical protein Pla123a_14620 [Posidoniimonas polymericola]|uniref:Uncharacterized protein n=1 Tax=Posidoniimonas polymericola TaxID=2528002 RepID=A0A5C5YS39_9BACT|nr:hypothetical protein [Posidoniimonas polymericola]TWT77666.1 hypothetical protein Pla123a_14620 [Posidoniimonas polymericola]
MGRYFMPTAYTTLAYLPRGVVSLAARLFGGNAMGCCAGWIACGAALTACGASGADPTPIYDSGWSVASPTLPQDSASLASPLGPSRVPADRFVGPRTLEKLHLPSREPQQDSDLQWRPVRTAQRPGAGPQHDGVLPPLPLGDEPPAADPDALEVVAPQRLAPNDRAAKDRAATDKAPVNEAPVLDAPKLDGPRLDNAFSVPDISGGATAPEMQALPEEPSPPAVLRKDGRKPAPFAATAAKPIDAKPIDAKPVDDQPITPEVERPDAPAAEPRPLAKPETKPAPVRADPVKADKTATGQSSEPDQPPAPPKSSAEDPDTRSSQSNEDDASAKRSRSSEADAATRRHSKTFVTPKEIERPQQPLKPLSRNQMNLRSRLRSVLAYYYRRPLNSADHDSWEVMHSMLSYGLYSRVQDGGRRGKPVTAVGYLCFNKPCGRYQMLYLTPEGNLDCRVGVGMQGHKGQLLAMLAQCNVSPDYPIRVEGKDFTIRDLIAAEQLTCYARTELTFKLIGLMHYLPSDSTWVNDQGEHWDFEKLIADERTQKIRGAACGGTHRLGGLALAAKKRVARGEPLDGEWAEAQKFVEEYQNYAFRLQNRDGSLSTEWFRGPGDEDDIDRRIRTTGHLLEWLIYSVPEEQLTEYRITRAVNYLTSLISSNTDNAWEIGPLAHALHALKLYDERVFEPYDDPSGPKIAGRSNRPVNLNYKSLQSGMSESYFYVQQRHEERENRGGLGGLFGIGSSSSRRSR